MSSPNSSKSSSKDSNACLFCHSDADDQLNYGELVNVGPLRVHYFCVLLSKTIRQSGRDDQGLYGFTIGDIRTELRMSRYRKCVYCHRYGANLECHTCTILFHLPCALQNNSLTKFHGNYLTYCVDHRPKNSYEIPEQEVDCPICLESISFDSLDVIWSQCCKVQAFFHKACAQRLALNAGYFTKCPMCNNTNIFIKTLRSNGVFVPQRDATWEIEQPNLFGVDEGVILRCQADACYCLQGRYYRSEKRWVFTLCQLCGQNAIHTVCLNDGRVTNLQMRRWECCDCMCEPWQDEFWLVRYNMHSSSVIMWRDPVVEEWVQSYLESDDDDDSSDVSSESLHALRCDETLSEDFEMYENEPVCGPNYSGETEMDADDLLIEFKKRMESPFENEEINDGNRCETQIKDESEAAERIQQTDVNIDGDKNSSCEETGVKTSEKYCDLEINDTSDTPAKKHDTLKVFRTDNNPKTPKRKRRRSVDEIKKPADLTVMIHRLRSGRRYSDQPLQTMKTRRSGYRKSFVIKRKDDNYFIC